LDARQLPRPARHCGNQVLHCRSFWTRNLRDHGLGGAKRYDSHSALCRSPSRDQQAD